MLGITNNYLMRNSANLIKAGSDKKEFFKFMEVQHPSKTYNQYGTSIVSQRVDRAIATTWKLDFNVKDFVLISDEKYMIADIPPYEELNPLTKFDRKITLRLIKIAN